MVIRNPKTNFYDFRQLNLEDMNLEQTAANTSIALTNDALSGSGVLLDFPEEITIFDSDSLTAAQAGWVAVSTFDGRGILSEPITASDEDEGCQVSVTVSDSKLDGCLSLTVTIIGKLFDDSLVYEHLEFSNNSTQVTKNHYKEYVNFLFQNFKGNSNIVVDGYGCFRTDGRVLITEASSYKVSPDLIAAEQIAEPDIIFRNYKTYDAGKTLSQVLQEAIGTSLSVDDLDVRTSSTATRTFAQGASSETIYAQKFQMTGTNIQKISILLSLASGSTWSGSLAVGIRKLQTTTSCPTSFLPDNEIDFDPDTVPVEEIILNQADLAARGVVLSTSPQVVDFVFTDAQISNPSLSTLSDGDFLALTIKRSGSTSTGTLVLEEASNTSSDMKLTVFQGNTWTDVSASSLWFRVWNDSVKVASGVALDQGVYLPIVKLAPGEDGVLAQHSVEDLSIVNSSEDTENYLIVQKDIGYSEVDIHQRTGDPIFGLKEDIPKFTVLEQADLFTLLTAEPSTVPLARIRDRNARANPTITGSIKYPGLCLDNTLDIVNPPSDLLTQNVVGSTIIPNTSKPTISYRIIKQETFTDLYGDVDGDGDLDVFDVTRLQELDGYQSYLSTGVSTSVQVAAIENRSVSILEILRADVAQTDGYAIGVADLSALNEFLTNGTAFPNGKSSFTRVRLTVEPILNPSLKLNSTADSTLELEQEDPDLIDPTKFSLSTSIPFSISFVAVWLPEQVEIVDLRRFANKSFLEFSSADLTSDPETGGQNSFFVAGDLYLKGQIKNLDSTGHTLDFEQNTIEIELPAGDTVGEINVFSNFISEQMKFSDGTLVSAEGINNNQVKMAVSLGSHVKNVSDEDGYVDADGYNDGYGANADEAIGAYIDHSTGLLRIRAYNIAYNEFFPELRTRILIAVSLKKAGFANDPVYVDASTLTSLIV